jgi:hypothetical protein
VPAVPQATAQLRADLVCAVHVLDLDGQGSGLGGHVPARIPGTETLLCHGFARSMPIRHSFARGDCTDRIDRPADRPSG